MGICVMYGYFVKEDDPAKTMYWEIAEVSTNPTQYKGTAEHYASGVCQAVVPFVHRASGYEGAIGILEEAILDYANKKGYVACAKPPVVIPWYVKEHHGASVIVVYTIEGAQHKLNLTIPGADDKITEELLRTTIEREVKTAAKKRRFIGMKGHITLTGEERRRGDSTGDTEQG